MKITSTIKVYENRANLIFTQKKPLKRIAAYSKSDNGVNFEWLLVTYEIYDIESCIYR